MNRLLGIVLFFSILSCCGCATEFNLATGQQETLMYDTEKEIAIGDSVAFQMEKNYKILIDVDVNARMQNILDRLVAVCDRKELVYSIKVIDDETVNAVSLPGGYVYLFKGLIDKLENDDQIAGVVAHEIGHVTARHGMKRLQASYGYALLQVAAITSGEPDVAYGVNAMYTTVFFSHSRRNEFEADRLAVKYTQKAGYDPNEMLKVLGVLRQEQMDAPLRTISYFRTHPFVNERMAIVQKEITGQIDFRGYLNITGNDL